MMIGFGLKQFKGMFFDRALVEGKIDRQTSVVMSRFGAFVRKTARGNFRRKTAKQPVPPKPRNLTDKLRGAILFGWDATRRTVVVGPWLFPNTRDKENPPPKRVERGGDYRITRRIKGVMKSYPAKYREFPFMRNALKEELPNLPLLWRNTIR
jgi:hypothetical protein